MPCKVENWSLKELSDALSTKNKEKRRIVVPIFQRGTRWNKDQEITFIDSLKKGYPVGTMLFYETIKNDCTTYVLVDGLQRGNSIRKYITNPTSFYEENSITDEFFIDLFNAINASNTEENKNKVRQALNSFIKTQHSYENIQYYSLAKTITEKLSLKNDDSNDYLAILIKYIELYFKDKQDIYSFISKTIIPVVVYSGEEQYLTEIFARINSKGTPLDQYEIYAASWPTENKFKVDNKDILEFVIKKYESMEDSEFELYGYDSIKIKNEKNLTAFEYLFGLSKWLTQTIDILNFVKKNESPDEVNTLGFELVNACLNETNKIHELYKKLNEIKNINEFETALLNAVKYVQKSVSTITSFKGNNRNKNKVFHSKFQIMSMVAAVFKIMYDNNNYSSIKEQWNEIKDNIYQNLRQYYVYDIITNYWSDGGTGKIYPAVQNRYNISISARTWGSALDSYFERSMRATETKKVATPSNEEYVFLNCIYLHTFSANDQLSENKFDIEHLATKELMKNLINKCNGNGLAISCIANLCYLPEAANRAKGKKTLYQDQKYLKKHELSDIEKKYSFTQESDLSWLDVSLFETGDFSTLKEFYETFCSTRFTILKKKFCESLNIEYIEKSNDKIIAETSSENIPKEHDKAETYNNDKTRLIFYLKEDKIPIASGTPTATNGFIIFTGSKINNKVTDSLPQALVNTRQEYIKENKIVDWKTTVDIEFSSSSAAAKFIRGRSASGPEEWITADGIKLKEFKV